LFSHACRVVAWVCVLALAFYSLSPPALKVAAGGESLPNQINHTAAYLVTSFALRWVYPGASPLRTMLWLVMYGCLLEVLQTFVPGRTPQVIDAAASALGAVIGAIIGLPLRAHLATWIAWSRKQ
jgi:VanZ family protein